MSRRARTRRDKRAPVPEFDQPEDNQAAREAVFIFRKSTMIGTQPTGAIQGVHISAVSHEGLTVTVNGTPGRLAIVTDDGKIIAAGKDVAREAEAVAVNSYREMLKGQGWLRVMSKPIQMAATV